MPLDPMLAQLISQIPAIPEGPVDYPAVREMADSMIPMIVGPDGTIEVGNVEDVGLVGTGGPVPLRIYRPIGDAQGTLHYVHGGGWAVGNLATVDHTARRLSRDLGMVVVTSSYRLAPEHPFPAAFEDSLTAARWVLQNRAELGGAGCPAIIGGDSAGGNLAAAVSIALRDSNDGTGVFDCQLLLYPAVDLRPNREYASRVRDADPTLVAGNLDMYAADYAGTADRSDPLISPLAADSLSGLPTALIVVLSVDPLHDEAIAYADRLRDSGVIVEVMEFDNLTHGFVHFAGIIPATAVATQQVVDRLKALVKGQS